ncbi:unnamed protein product [Prunus armeniaca]
MDNLRPKSLISKQAIVNLGEEYLPRLSINLLRFPICKTRTLLKVIAKSIALVKKQQETQRAELTSSELALFEDAEVEHSTAVPVLAEQSEQSALEPVAQAELPVAAPEPEMEVEYPIVVPDPEVEKDKTAGVLTVAISPLKPPIVVIHFIPSKPATTLFAAPELAEFEAMDLDAQLDRLEKLSSTPSKAKSKVVDEAVDGVKIWQSTELELDENR